MAEQQVTMTCIDPGNLWRTSEGNLVNNWLHPVEGGTWLVSVIKPPVAFRLIPFGGKKAAEGVKPHPDDRDPWSEVAKGATKKKPRIYDVLVEFIPDPKGTIQKTKR